MNRDRLADDRSVRPGLPRPLEAVLALAGLVLVSPLLLLAGAAIAASSRGPVLFTQVRVGRHGRPFAFYKLRSMKLRPKAGDAGDWPSITAAGDRRITAVGRVLRRTKVDELPGLWNVVRGDMSLVGPRPEVPELVDLEDPRWRRVLAVRPGLTNPVTLQLRNEELLLAGAEPDFYVGTLLPYKLLGYLAYLERRTAWSDLAVLWQTALGVLLPHRTPPPTPAAIRSAVAGPESNARIDAKLSGGRR